MKMSANGTIRQKARIVPAQMQYHANPLFHTQGPPVRSRPPITFYTMRHGLRGLATPTIMEAMTPYMIPPPIALPPVILVGDETLSKRSKGYLSKFSQHWLLFPFIVLLNYVLFCTVLIYIYIMCYFCCQ